MATKGERTRQRIIDSANRLVYERGFHDMSFADVAKASGVPKGNFYFHFKSKDDLLAAVAEDRRRRLSALLAGWEQQFDAPASRLKRMSEMITRDAADIVRYGCPMGSILLELGKQETDLRDAMLPLFTMLRNWATAQFAEIVGPAAAAGHARDMLVRMQGASVLAAAYGEADWLDEAQAGIARWIDGLAHVAL